MLWCAASFFEYRVVSALAGALLSGICTKYRHDRVPSTAARAAPTVLESANSASRIAQRSPPRRVPLAMEHGEWSITKCGLRFP